MNYEGYAAACTGVITGLIAGFIGIMLGDVIGGMFSGVCFFVFGMAGFAKVTDAVKRYKAIQAWERHHNRNVDFRVGRPVKGMPDYVEIEI